MMHWCLLKTTTAPESVRALIDNSAERLFTRTNLRDSVLAAYNFSNLKELLRRYSQSIPFNDRQVYPLLKRLGVRVLANLLDGAGNWLRMFTALRAKGILLDPLQHDAITTFQNWLSSVQVGPQKLEDSPSWTLKGLDRKWTGWTLPSKTWYKLLTIDEEPDDLTSKWPNGTYGLTWIERWKKLWGAGGLTRTRTWLWKLLHHAFFTGERASKMQARREIEGSFNPSAFATRWRQGLRALSEINKMLEVSVNLTITSISNPRELKVEENNRTSNRPRTGDREQTLESEDRIDFMLNLADRGEVSIDCPLSCQS
ncbi:hypothetical protein R1flu_006891 [Riccia fluitans]|uniref:Uncharacterized protein n=1 Tax=Riccia fluitans TaxID=41844 RepID=A0ABD1Z0C6_9MARC